MPIDSRYSGAIGGAAQGAKIGSAFGGWGAGIGAVAGGLLGGLAGGGEDEAKELAEMQEQYIWSAFAENRRRALLEMGQTVGTARAAIGASNIQFGGSPKKYVNAIEGEYRRQMAWDRQKAKIDAEMAQLGGSMAADNIRYSGLQSMIGGVGSAISQFGFGGAPKTSSAGASVFGPKTDDYMKSIGAF